MNALNLILAFITIALLFIAVFKPNLLKLFLEWLWQAILTLWNWNFLIAFFSAMIESFPVIWVIVPWMQVMLMVWGFFWKFYLPEVILLAIAWAMLWNYFGYILWVKYWDSFLKKYWDWFGMWKTELKMLKKQIDKNWPWFIIIWKFHNFTRAFVPFIAWSMWMKKTNFWKYNILWSIIWAITIITLWVVFAHYYKIIVDLMSYIIFGIFILIWTYIYFFKKKEFAEYIREKNEEIDEKLSKK